MTKAERSNPDILNPSRKNRIARGAGVDIADVNRLVKQVRTDEEDDEADAGNDERC